MKSPMPCPCKSHKTYEHCCKPFHEGKPAPDAVHLMRSRYSAYALGLAEYIMKTTHPEHPDQQKKSWDRREEILHFTRETEFTDLEILSSELYERTAFVTFTAFLKQQGKDVSFTEKSLFEKIENLWLYKDAQFL